MYHVTWLEWIKYLSIYLYSYGVSALLLDNHKGMFSKTIQSSTMFGPLVSWEHKTKYLVWLDIWQNHAERKMGT